MLGNCLELPPLGLCKYSLLKFSSYAGCKNCTSFLNESVLDFHIRVWVLHFWGFIPRYMFKYNLVYKYFGSKKYKLSNSTYIRNPPNITKICYKCRENLPPIAANSLLFVLKNLCLQLFRHYETSAEHWNYHNISRIEKSRRRKKIQNDSFYNNFLKFYYIHEICWVFW